MKGLFILSFLALSLSGALLIISAVDLIKLTKDKQANNLDKVLTIFNLACLLGSMIVILCQVNKLFCFTSM